MGLHAEILIWLKSICPWAFRLGEELCLDSGLYVHDALTYLRRIRGPEAEGRMTGAQLFHLVSVPIFTRFSAGVLVEIFSTDIYEVMPSFKFAEQAKRDKARLESKTSLPPYPDEALISEKGICVEPSTGVYEPFDIHRVLSSRRVLRETLMRFLDMQFRAVRDRFPPGRALIMDYSIKGPVLLTKRYVGPMVLRGGYTNKLDTKPRILRMMGEADHALPFWLRVFKDRPNKIVDTVDRDVLMHVLAYITTAEEEVTGRITWTYFDEKSGQLMQVDMIMLAKRMLANEFRLRKPLAPWTPGDTHCTLMQFLFRCIFMGTDFLPKSAITDRLKTDKIMMAIHAGGEKINKFRVPLFQMRRREQLAHAESTLFPHLDCDPFYIRDRPDPAVFSVCKFPPGIADLVCGYSHPDANEEESNAILRAIDSSIASKSFERRFDLCRVLQYVLVNWNLLEFAEDPVLRYFRMEPESNSDRKRVRDEAPEQDNSERAAKMAR